MQKRHKTPRFRHFLVPALACALLLPGWNAAPGASLDALLAIEKSGPPGGENARSAFYADLAQAWTDHADTLADTGKESAKRAKAAAENAVAAARKAVALGPASCRAHTTLAVALGKNTDYVDNSTKMALSREIRAEAEAALAIDPDDELAHHILGRWNYGFATINPVLRLAARAVYGKLPDASLEKARFHLEKAEARNPRRLTTHYTLALIEKQSGAKEKARRHWEAVLALPATDAEERAAQKEARKALGVKNTSPD